MKISVPLKDGYLPDDFGKYSSLKKRVDGNNVYSFPITIEEAPQEAKSLALTFIDYDSTPVCGFTWVHWIACGIDPKAEYIPENASHSGEFSLIQGFNSCVSRPEETTPQYLCGYIGPCPPDKDHCYTLRVYALDQELALEPGFYYNDLHWALQGHVIDSAELNVMSRA